MRLLFRSPTERLTLFCIISLLLMMLLPTAVTSFQWRPHYLHGPIEIFSVIVSSLVFFTGISIPRRHVNLPIVVVSLSFAGVAIIDIIHYLSTVDMPPLITANSEQKAITAWLFARVLAAVAILITVFVPRKWKVGTETWLAGTIIVSCYTAFAVFATLDLSSEFPSLFIKGQGVTPLKRAIEYSIIVLNTITLLRLIWLVKHRRIHTNSRDQLFAAIFFMGLSEFSLNHYLAGTDLFNLYGHILKVLSYYYFYKVIQKEMLLRPYDQLEHSQRNLRDSLQQVSAATEKIEKQNRELMSLYHLSLTLIRRLDLDDALKTVVEQALEMSKASYGSLYLVNEGESSATLRYATGYYEQFVGYKILFGEGMTGRVLETKQPLSIHDYHAWEGRLPALYREEKIGAVAVPLVIDQRVVGVLGISFIDQQPPLETVSTLEKFAALASIVIDNSLLFQQARHEIKERKAAERAFAASEAKYRFLAEHSSDVIWTTDDTGRITYISPSVQSIIGRSRDALLRMPLTELLTEETRIFIAPYLRPEHNSTAHIIEAEMVGENGNLPVEITISPLGAEGDYGYQGTFRDITERKLAETIRLDSQKREALMAHLASLGTMVAAVAHEINQPLQALQLVLGGLPYLYRRGDTIGIEDILRSYTLAMEQAGRIERTVQRLRSYVQQRDNKSYNFVHVKQIIDGALRMVGDQLKTHGINVIVECPSGTMLWSNQQNLEDVLINLASNALQAMVEAETPSKEFCVRVFDWHDYVRVEVSNNGPDIPNEILPHVFEPFFTTKQGSTGMGLGLAIVETIVLDHGGTIDVQNLKPGVIFVLTFPKHTNQV